MTNAFDSLTLAGALGIYALMSAVVVRSLRAFRGEAIGRSPGVDGE